MIPLVHDFSGATVLVLGGGPVAARKARRFAREARVIVVSPSFEGDFSLDEADGTEGDGTDEAADDGTDAIAEDGDADAPGIDLVRAAPAPEEVSEWIERTAPALVVAATDDEAVNAAATRAARERGALVNRADRSGERDPGSVVVPATVEDGPVTVSVSTGGRSPALSAYLRERIETDLAGAGAMAELTADLRAELRAAGWDPGPRRDAIRAVVRSSAVWKALRTGGANARQEASRVIRNTEGER